MTSITPSDSILWDVTRVPPIGLISHSVRASSSWPITFLSILTNHQNEKSECITHLAAQARPQFHR